jgi:hypothetical protein
MSEIQNSEGRIIRKKSFQAIAMQKVMPLDHHKLRTILFREIHDICINMDEFSGLFKISNII